MPQKLLICCLAVLGFSMEATGTDMVVRIETARLSSATALDTVDLFLESDSSLGGFDLKLMVAGSQLEIVGILPGRLIDTCRWEFFNARELMVVLDDPDSEQPAWQITALPELIPDSIKPACYGGFTPMSLCRIIVYSIQLNLALADTGQPLKEAAIRFVWEDCGDNTISSFSGKNLWLSWQAAGSDSTVAEAGFPNRSGASNSCLTPRNSDRVKRLVRFKPGMIIIQRDRADSLSADSSDS